MQAVDAPLIRFAAVGVVNSAGGYFTIVAFLAAGLGNILANLLGYLIGLCSSFVLNRYWTFRSAENTTGLIAKFAIVVVVAYLCNLAVVVWLLETMNIDAFVAQAAGMPVYALISYAGMKYAVFCERRVES